MENSILQLVLETLITVLVPILVGYLVKFIDAKIKELHSFVERENLWYVYDVVKQLVYAAEQSGLAGLIAAEGAAKKEYVLKKAQEYLDAKGIKVNVSTLEAMIEAAVYEAFNK